jgi:drug/metabolite transporter (DMT)-like permease
MFAMNFGGIAYGIAAAILFGLSAPCAKLLLLHTDPLTLAALLYLGAGLGLSIYRLAPSRDSGTGFQREAQIRIEDTPMLAAIVLLGGVAGPFLLLAGLQHMTGLSGSLMLNLETPFTIIVALSVFGEHLAWDEIAGSTAIIGGAALLGANGGSAGGDTAGVLAMAGACLAWAFDNNLTQRLSMRDPVAVARIKTLGAGISIAAIVWSRGGVNYRPAVIIAAMTLGLFSYGVSLVFYIRALRSLGAARQASLFTSAPFAGAMLSIPLLHETPQPLQFLAGILMAVGLASMIRARHSHLHRHATLAHEHAHVHDDEHHPHTHGEATMQPHSHWHLHEALAHEHPHRSDLHHRHAH